MLVAIAMGVLGLLVVVVAYYRDEPIERRRDVRPEWPLLPAPSDIVRTEFPLSFPGYDPATVEYHLEMLSRSYSDLMAAATPEVLTRARHRAALRRGIEHDETTVPYLAPPVEEQRDPPSAASSGDHEALRAEAALADIEAQHMGERGL